MAIGLKWNKNEDLKWRFFEWSHLLKIIAKHTSDAKYPHSELVKRIISV